MTKTTAAWVNRIVGHGEEAPDQLLANPKNWRTHPANQRDALRGALDQVGWVQQVMVNRITGHIVDGHARVEEALSRGEATVPVLYVELEPHEEDVVLATLDPIGALATRDDERLRMLLAEVEFDAQALREMTNDLMPKEAKVGLTDPDDVPELADDSGIKPGDLFALGDHRLMCGDSTKAEDVARLMDGERAECVWTDPPYGVAIGDKNKYLNSIARSNRVEENLSGDATDEATLRAMLVAAFDNAVAVTEPGGAWYVAAPPGPLHVLFGQELKDRGIWHQTIQWVKNNATFSPMGVDYHWRAEPIFYGWTPGAGHRYYGGRKQDTVWEIDRPVASPDHPTMKPVELVRRAIENSSLAGQIVLDPFMGSGTTILAAEQTSRKAYGIELAPRYVAVAIKRWEQFTGKRAEKLDG